MLIVLDRVALPARGLVGGVRNGFTMFEQEGARRSTGVVKYDCLQCKHNPVHKAITSSRAMATMMLRIIFTRPLLLDVLIDVRCVQYQGYILDAGLDEDDIRNRYYVLMINDQMC